MTDQNTFQIAARCTQQSAPLLVDWKSAQTQDMQPQNAPHCHQNPVLKFSAGIPALTSFSFPAVLVVLFLSSLSLPQIDLLSSFLLVILSSFPPFIGCFTSTTKERIPINPKQHFHVQTDKPAAPTHCKHIIFATYFALFNSSELYCTEKQ